MQSNGLGRQMSLSGLFKAYRAWRQLQQQLQQTNMMMMMMMMVPPSVTESASGECAHFPSLPVFN